MIMSKDKEWSAVAALLKEINKLRERVEMLEIYTWAYMARWAPRASDVIWYRWSYEDIWPRPNLDRTNEVITLNAPQNRIGVNDSNDTIPLADVRITDDWYTRTATYCASSHI